MSCNTIQLLLHNIVLLLNGCHPSKHMCVKYLKCSFATVYKGCIMHTYTLGCTAKLYLKQYHLAPSGKRVILLLYMLWSQALIFVFSQPKPVVCFFSS